MYEFIDPAFNKDFTRHCALLIQLEEQQVSFALLGKHDHQLHAVKILPVPASTGPVDYVAKLRVVMNSEDLLHVPVWDTKISLAHTPFTLIPRVLFDENQAADYLRLSAKTGAQDTVFVNSIRHLFVKNVFSVDNTLHHYFEEIFPSAAWYHITSGILESGLMHKDTFGPQQICLDVKPNLLHISYFENGEFRYINQFRFANKDDFLYFVLLVTDRFQVERNTCDLKLSGEILPDSLLFAELWKFFQTISFMPIQNTIRLPESLEESMMHVFNTLLSLDICE